MIEKILFKQIFNSENILFRNDFAVHRKTSLDIEDTIDKNWLKSIQDAKESKKELWNGENYRANTITLLGETLTIKLGKIWYKEQIAFRALVHGFDLDEDYLPKGMYSICFITSKDQYYIFGQNGNTFARSHTLFIGGCYSIQEDQLLQGKDLFDGAIREIVEEINIDTQYIENIDLIGSYQSCSGNIGFCFHVYLNKDIKKVQEVFLSKKNSEITALTIVKADMIRPFIRNLSENKKIMEKFLD